MLKIVKAILAKLLSTSFVIFGDLVLLLEILITSKHPPLYGRILLSPIKNFFKLFELQYIFRM